MAKLNKSTSTSSKLKASGAKYSTTNSSGKQTFYSSSKAAEGGKENAIGTSTRTNTAVIPMNAMQNTGVPDIPDKPKVQDVGTVGLGAIPGYNVQNNQYVYDPKLSETQNAVEQANQQGASSLQSILSFIGKPEEKAPVLAQIEKDAKIQQKEQEVNNYTTDLNQIVAKQQQDLLQLRGTGSEQGVTEAVYGGQQATINREAAIRALPVQAALSAAQGNLEMAQKQVERLFALKSEDIDAEYKYKKDVGTAFLQYANESQSRRLNAQLGEIENKRQDAKDKLEYERQVSLRNISNSGSTFGGSSVGENQTYANDLDAIVGTVLSTIPSKFGQQTFNNQIGNARNDTDKLNIVAAQVLQGQPAEFKNDFRNQAVGIAQLDKAIEALDKGVQTGVFQNSAQYAANFFGKDYDPKLAEISGLITSAIQPYRNSVTGAAWGDQEDGEYQQLFGSTKYSPSELRQRLLQTKELLKSKSSEGLNSFVNPLGTYDNPFKTAVLAPTLVTSPTTTETPITRGFWGNIGNFLWGND